MPISNAELFTYKVIYDYPCRPTTGADFVRKQGFAVIRHYTASDAIERVRHVFDAKHPSHTLNVLDVKAVPELQETVDESGALELQEAD